MSWVKQRCRGITGNNERERRKHYILREYEQRIAEYDAHGNGIMHCCKK